jgi:hypothetical protein
MTRTEGREKQTEDEWEGMEREGCNMSRVTVTLCVWRETVYNHEQSHYT